ncbi:DUF1028 domain-containing protein [Pseudarthrobacter sp. P1]|uniref:DUF1028 domain-containing protein n=1 Tax=Pseudarthrobacter sp. P1 TaxID=3418418 RepID=UPI003CECDF76
MTFSLVARDPLTGAFGMVVTSSSPAVAARCVHLRQGVGGAASQNITDPGLGAQLLDLLEAGTPADEAMAKLVAGTPDIDYRQLSVVDASGGTASFSGSGTLGTHRTVAGDGAVAAGNLLSSPDVVDAILAGYSQATGAFEDRLLAGLAAGRDAGGEEGPQHSAGLVVVDQAAWPVTDLRVDWDDEDPIAALAQLWALWEPQKLDYYTRAVHPETAPSYGVPGDL